MKEGFRLVWLAAELGRRDPHAGGQAVCSPDRDLLTPDPGRGLLPSSVMKRSIRAVIRFGRNCG